MASGAGESLSREWAAARNGTPMFSHRRGDLGTWWLAIHLVPELFGHLFGWLFGFPRQPSFETGFGPLGSSTPAVSGERGCACERTQRTVVFKTSSCLPRLLARCGSHPWQLRRSPLVPGRYVANEVHSPLPDKFNFSNRISGEGGAEGLTSIC